MTVRLLSLIGMTAAAMLAQQEGRLTVSVEPKDNQWPAVEQDALSVQVDGKPARVETWAPLTGENAQLQLYIVIDDAVSTKLGIQFGDLKNFIQAQPASTEIGIAYLQYGTARIVQTPTADHARAAKALRLPLGEPGIDASPYVAIGDLIKKWPPAEGRREILAITSGIDPLYQSPDMFDPYLMQAIDAAEKGGVVVSSIYYTSAGHFGHSFYRRTWGQNFLSLLDEDLGGEYYWEGLSSPVAFQPFLTEFSTWLAHQYRLTVRTEEAGKPELKPVELTAKRGISLVTASRIYLQPVNAGSATQPK